MPDAFQQGIEATIRYVERLREQGVRYVAVAPGTLEALSRPVPRSDRPPGRAPSAQARPAPNRTVVTPTPPTNPAATQEAGSTGPGGPLPGDLRPRVPLSGAAKEEAMSALRDRALVCQRCPHLAGSRTQVVFGVGDIHSPLMFVGEAPGADEDREGEPFVGRAGQLLTRIIETMGLGRDRVYIGNILKCRPDTPGQRSGNRKPTADEMQTCLPYLLEQIDIIQPRVLVALGATAVEGLFGRAMPITRVRGTWLEFRGIPTMPTYHPAYLLRNQSLAEKRKVWEDMLQVMDRLGMPISEKQRAYFRSPAV
jgi:uracil-DNA glycosylase